MSARPLGEHGCLPKAEEDAAVRREFFWPGDLGLLEESAALESNNLNE
ncbi:MAG: hypothetical protein AB7W28_02675 [Armatimonadota bacterium]